MGGFCRLLGCGCCWWLCFKRWVEVTSAAAPGRVGGIAPRKTEHSVPFGSHSWKGWEDRASSATAAARVRRGLIPRLILIFPCSGFLAVFSPDFRLSWVQFVRHTVNGKKGTKFCTGMKIVFKLAEMQGTIVPVARLPNLKALRSLVQGTLPFYFFLSVVCGLCTSLLDSL